MSSAIPTIPNAPASVARPADVPPKPSYAANTAAKPLPPVSPSESPERHYAAASSATTALSSQALSSTDVAYVESLMGALPAQKMEEILLKTGVPVPANLGPNIDTMA